MPKYEVTLVATASTTVEVEAESEDEAREAVWERDLPYASAFAGYDLGDWNFPSDADPEWNKPEDDIVEVSE